MDNLWGLEAFRLSGTDVGLLLRQSVFWLNGDASKRRRSQIGDTEKIYRKKEGLMRCRRFIKKCIETWCQVVTLELQTVVLVTMQLVTVSVTVSVGRVHGLSLSESLVGIGHCASLRPDVSASRWSMVDGRRWCGGVDGYR